MKPGLDPLGDRFKPIEREWRTNIPSDQFMVIRLDGKAFHTWTRGLSKPFDMDMLFAMDQTTQELCEQIQGALCGYTQSDEISIVCAPAAKENSQIWFNGQVQKVVSVASSVATAKFNMVWRTIREAQKIDPPSSKPAWFDARVFPLPDVSSVADYLWWRQSDARRNAVSMLAEHELGSKAIHGLTTSARVALLADAGIILAEEKPRPINGGLCAPVARPSTVTYEHKKTGEVHTVDVVRRVWEQLPADYIRNWFFQTHQHLYEPGAELTDSDQAVC